MLLVAVVWVGLGRAQHEGEGEEHHEFHVFHEEWSRVEVPYVVGLWIIATTLIKLGQSPQIKT